MMKLFSLPASPYGRKVMLSILELGLEDRIEFVPTAVFEDEGYRKVNPLGRIPALLPADGEEVLFDSLVICDYLDQLQGGDQLIPLGKEERTAVLRLHALASGINDSVINFRAQKLRNSKLADKIPDDWYIDRQKAAIYAGLDELENSTQKLVADVNLGILATACLLGYLDFRLPELEWRKGRDKLASWFESFSERPSMKKTFPTD